MEAIVAQRKEKDKATGVTQISSDSQSEERRENGATAGVPLFLQTKRQPNGFVSSSSKSTTPHIQRQAEESEGEQEEEEELIQPKLQSKLMVGASDDPYERQADRVAERVTQASRSVPNATSTGSGAVGIQRETVSESEEEEVIQAKSVDTGAGQAAGAGLQKTVSSPGSGSPLSEGIRSSVEPVLGSDLSHVRVHNNSASHAAAKSINAKAFTHGNNIWLGAGQRENDLGLMAHEATHVVQQTAPSISRKLDDRIQRQTRGDVAESSDVSGGVEPNYSVDESLNSEICMPAGEGVVQAESEPEVYDSYNSALNSGMTRVQRTAGTAAFLRETYVPGFKAARDAADPAAAMELGAAIVQGIGSMRTALTEVMGIVTTFDPGEATSSSLDLSVSLMEPDEMDFVLHSDLVVELALVTEDLEHLERLLLVALGPQQFRDNVLAGRYTVPDYDDRLQAIIREASFTIDILITAVAMKERMLSADSYAEYQEVVSMAEMWRSRPINFYFLYSVLHFLLGSAFNLLVRIPGASGRNLMQMRGDAQDNSRAFGVMADVGMYNEDLISDLLTYSLGDWAITDENALAAFEVIASASSAARLPILERLAEHGLLTRLCNNLPSQYVQALLTDIGGARGLNAPPVAFILQNSINENSGGGETVSEIYEANIMENLAEDNYARAYLWTFLNVAHSATSLGFKDIHDQAYQARREGLISSDAYWSTTAKAAGRSAALLAVTAVSGGTAGGFSEGLALARGAGATTASLIGAGVGGGVAGFTGQLTGDIYDQALLGKEGFSSIGDYARSTALGAGSGLLVAGVGAASARYLPGGAASAQRMFEYHSGSPAGRYSFAQGPRQALHGGLYSMYRNASMYGRNVGRSSSLPPEQYQEYFEFGSDDARHHTFEGDLSTNPNTGELRGRGGHLWPSNRAGGSSAAGSGPSGPKSAFPRSWSQERIMEVVADTYTDPGQSWLQQGGPGQGSMHNGLPEHIRTNAGNPVRFRADRVIDGVTVRVVWEPGGGELITAFPVGSGDTANLLMTIPPYASFSREDSANEEQP